MILRFASFEERETFVEKVRTEFPDLSDHLEKALSVPDIRAPDTLDQVADRFIKEKAASVGGRVIPNVLEEPFEPSL